MEWVGRSRSPTPHASMAGDGYHRLTALVLSCTIVPNHVTAEFMAVRILERVGRVGWPHPKK